MTVSLDGVLVQMGSIVVLVNPKFQKGNIAMVTATNAHPVIVTVIFVAWDSKRWMVANVMIT